MKAYICLKDFFHSEETLAQLRKCTTELHIHPTPQRPQQSELKELLQQYDLLIIGTKEFITRDLLQVKPLRTRIIATLSTGTDHIDLEALEEHGITLIKTYHANVSSVAEHTLASLMHLRKRFWEGDSSVRAHKWRSGLTEFPREVRGMKVGLVGAGLIAYQTALLLKAFSAKIFAWTFRPDKHPEFETLGVTWVPSLEALFAQTEAVSLHIPLSEQTKDFIGSKHFEQIQHTPFLFINTARSGLVAKDTLPQALAKQQVAFAALDLLREDEKPEQYPEGQVLLTPHVAGVTLESIQRLGEELIENIIKHLTTSP